MRKKLERSRAEAERLNEFLMKAKREREMAKAKMATKSQLMSLQAITGRSWAELNLTEEQARDLIAQFDDVENDYGPEAAKEALDDIQTEMEIASTDDDDDTEGEKGKGKAAQKKQGEGEGDGETEAEAAQPDTLDDHIVRIVRSRRDEVLEGIELGGGAKRVIVETPEIPDGKDMGLQHRQFPTLLKLLASPHKRPIMLVGPAGSSKTSSVKAAAEALGVDFFATSNSTGDMPSDKFGFNTADGTFMDRALTRSIRQPSVFLDDEADATNARIGVKMNMLIDNRFAEIGGEMVQAHPDWRYVASANTFGYGADRIYVGRNQMDASTLNRFLVLEWDYDRDLEKAIAPNKEWCEYVWKVRDVVSKHVMRYVVGSRQILYGGELLNMGFSWEQAQSMTLFPGWKNDDVKRVTAEAGNR